MLIIPVDDNRRIKIYKEGGLTLEAKVSGIGWILDNEADIPDHVILAYLKEAKRNLDTAIDKMTPTK